MANPRQRSKARSSSHKAVKQSRRAGKNLKKQPPLKGPKLLQEAWDRHKTVRQNYESLGLAHTLNPTAAGGSENPYPAPSQKVSSIESTPSTSVTQAPLPSGFGRIVRDSEGNVIRVEMPESDVADVNAGILKAKRQGKAKASPWGDAMEDSDEESARLPREAAVWKTLRPTALDGTDAKAKGKNPGLLSALETLASSGVKTPRHASTHETKWLRDLIRIHGRDVDAMARDLKGNVWQKTRGELKRAIIKAGGFEKLERTPVDGASL